MKIHTINPATEEKIKVYNLFTKLQLDSTITKSRDGFKKWKSHSVKYRSSTIKQIGKGLLKNKNKFAKLITEEMGKPIKESIAEIEKCAWSCNYFSDNAEKFLQDEKIKTEHKHSYIRFEPLGKILCVMPWNFPFWQVFRCVIPALCAGNSVILKHSSITLGCSLEIERFLGGYLAKGVFQNVITNGEGVNYLMDHVEGVSLTGSVQTGRTIAENAGKRLKKVVLELGGSDPFIVLKDADMNFTCKEAIKGRFVNSGQSCIASKRFIIVKEIFDEFAKNIIDLVKNLKIGNPMDLETDIGPLARREFVVGLDKQVKDSIKQGAKLLYGGKVLQGKGYYYMPTILITNSNMRVVKEETFGPVFTLIKVNNEKEAIKEANKSEFGLGASIWTKDMKKGTEYAKEIESGFVAVNNVVRSDPRLPFGGVKNSGLGRELDRYGMLEFCNIKTVIAD